MHPKTAQGVAGAEARYGRASDNLSFAKETAAATGRDKRSVQRDAERGEKVIDAAIDIIRGTVPRSRTMRQKPIAVARDCHSTSSCSSSVRSLPVSGAGPR